MSEKTKGIVSFCLYTGKTRNFICELLDSKEKDIAIFAVKFSTMILETMCLASQFHI